MNPSQIFYLLHVFFIGPLFIYIGIAESRTPNTLLSLLGFLALFVVFFHTYVVYYKYIHKKNFSVNLLHVFFLAPIMFFIAYSKSPNDLWYKVLLMLGFINIAYHGMKAIRNDILDLSYLDPFFSTRNTSLNNP